MRRAVSHQADRLRRSLFPTAPKPESGPIAKGKDGPFLRGDRSLSAARGEKE
ncbi:hypothetical protein [Laspinema olomoucense]|uniref:hypothetical protein n=1 Tax=Laspinema olomoucense TaxID=3231600 RepID=UPI0021BB2FAA|nr:hypothetical protein [Laspinema sp. D3d]